jgi:outer membrane protein assembly factor BamE
MKYPQMQRSYYSYYSYLISRIAKSGLMLLCCVLLSACNTGPLRFPGVYRIDIPQGNVMTQDMIDQLRPGLTKRQVNFIMGTPLIKDTFDQDRWDYLYSFQPGGKERVQETLSLYFENDALTHFTGDFTQTEGKEQFGQVSPAPAADADTDTSTDPQ